MRYIPLLLRYFALLLPFPGSSPFTFAMPSVFFHFSDWRYRPDGCLTPPPTHTNRPLSLPQCHRILSFFSTGAFGWFTWPFDSSSLTFAMPLDLAFFPRTLSTERRTEPFPCHFHKPFGLRHFFVWHFWPVGAPKPPSPPPPPMTRPLSLPQCHRAFGLSAPWAPPTDPLLLW